jgi:hypothetical protein
MNRAKSSAVARAYSQLCNMTVDLLEELEELVDDRPKEPAHCLRCVDGRRPQDLCSCACPTCTRTRAPLIDLLEEALDRYATRGALVVKWRAFTEEHAETIPAPAGPEERGMEMLRQGAIARERVLELARKLAAMAGPNLEWNAACERVYVELVGVCRGAAP